MCTSSSALERQGAGVRFRLDPRKAGKDGVAVRLGYDALANEHGRVRRGRAEILW